MSEAARSDVVIVGAGVIGAACAFELASRGVAVTVVDRGEVGHGCSYGNAGWLTPSLANPLPGPGVVRQAMRWAFDPDSPLYIRPSLRPALLRWLAGFAAASRHRPFVRGTEALVELSKYSLDTYARWSREFPEPFGFEQRGLLMVTLTAEGLASARKEVELMRGFGIAAEPLDGEGVRAREPAVTADVPGGVFFPQEAHAEPLAVVRALAAAAERAGARFLTGTEVFGFEGSGARLTAVRTTRGRLPAGQFVLAAGSWSNPLGRTLGLRVPVLGGKGYAIVVKPLRRGPRVPLKLLERRIAITPRADGLRLAGTLELVDGDESITARRVDAIVRGSRLILDVPDPPEIVELWRGLRPCTPDGMPIIGKPARWPNLLLATGHQMLGLHCAPGTARLAAELLTGEAPFVDPAPFRADRF